MKISIAGLNVELNERYDFIKEIAKDYVSDSPECDFSVYADDKDIENEAALADMKYPKGYLESTAVYRKIAEKLPHYGGVVFHGAVIAYNGKAYAFTARSGVGKTTHIRLWLKILGEDAHVLNGDKPILRVIDGVVYASGTPWRGKEGYGRAEMLPLAAVGFIERAEKPSAERITNAEALMRFASQVYIPKDPASAALALSALNKIITGVRLYNVRANMEDESARVSLEAMTEAR